MKIPVIGVPIVNGTHWVHRLISSIDYPVENLFIINNNGKGEINEELDNISKMKHPFIDKIFVAHMPSNIGVAASWNLIVKSFITKPYWLMPNHDIAFTPGFLAEMIEAASDPEVGMVHGNGGDFGDGSYDLFLIKDWVIKKIGLFDENTYPAYGEDVDYIMRLKNTPIKTVTSISKTYYHGYGNNYYETGAQTKKASPELTAKLDEVNLINFEYLTEKWGQGWRMTNPTPYPFDRPDIPHTYTSFDIEYARRKYLGF
jgi:hypothetical protein